MLKRTSTFNRIWEQCAIIGDEQEIKDRLYKWATPHERWCITRYLNSRKPDTKGPSVSYSRAKVLNLGAGAILSARHHLPLMERTLREEADLAASVGDITLSVNNRFLADECNKALAAINNLNYTISMTQNFYRSRNPKKRKKGKEDGQCT